MADDPIDVSGLVDDERQSTEQIHALAPRTVRRFRVVVDVGPAAGKDLTANSTADRLSIGSHPSNGLVIDDPAVSRFHCEIVVDERGIWLADLDSMNGTVLDGVPLGRGALRDGSTFRIGRCSCRFELAVESNPMPLSARTRLGGLIGSSYGMRAAFALLERAARSEVTVLVEGETGTGKEGAAEAIHRESDRRDKPFLVVDCGAVPANLLESELFGHERGAFTGANEKRIGVFEAADGGTVFLDEIGELPLELQPKLLRVLEQRQVKSLGSTKHRAVDVRIVAATHRDLRALVNQGTFRSDLYFRLAVLVVRIPALRSRPEDIPALVRHFLTDLGETGEAAKALLTPESVARMQRAAWPGNVRELRNHVQRSLVFEHPLEGAEEHAELSIDTTVPYTESKRRLLDVFERRYIDALLARHHGNVAQAARAAGMDRVYVYKMMQRHGMRPRR